MKLCIRIVRFHRCVCALASYCRTLYICVRFVLYACVFFGFSLNENSEIKKACDPKSCMCLFMGFSSISVVCNLIFIDSKKKQKLKTSNNNGPKRQRHTTQSQIDQCVTHHTKALFSSAVHLKKKLSLSRSNSRL